MIAITREKLKQKGHRKVFLHENIYSPQMIDFKMLRGRASGRKLSSRSVWPVASSPKLGYKFPQALLVPSHGKPNWGGHHWRDREMEGFGTDTA